MSAVVEQVRALLEPIAGGTRCGVDTRDEPDAIRLRDEVSKLEGLHGNLVDWALVERIGVDLLARSTKDIRIASQVAHAMSHTRGLEGALAGVTLLRGVIDTFWDGLHPERPKGRASAVAWFVTRSEHALPTMRLTQDHAAVIQDFRNACDALANTVRERFGDSAPAMQPLLDAVTRLQISDAPGPSDAPTQAVAAVVEVASAVASAVSETPPTPSVEEAPSPAPQSEHPRTWAAAWSAPIAPDAPQGKDVRNEPSFLSIRDAVQMAEHPAGGVPDWQAVISRSSQLLKEQSKDLRVAAFYAYAAYREQGLEGLTVGLSILGALLETHWEGVFPSMERSSRARSSALAWLFPRLDNLGQHPLKPADGPLVARLSDAAAYVVEQVHARFAPGEAPATGPLLEQVSRLQLSIPSVSVTPTTGPAPVVAATQVGAPSSKAANGAVATSGTTSAPAIVTVNQTAPAVPKSADASQVRAYVRTLARDMMQVADALLDADPTAPESYRLARFALYGSINKNPTADNGRLPQASPEFVLAALERMLTAQEWDKLVVTAEKTVRSNPFLLDGHRYLLLAMDRLGDPYRVARGVVFGEMVALLKRAPDIAELCFSDGKPIAQPITKDWIRQVVMPSGPGAAGPAVTPQDEDIAKARALAASGKGKQALDALEQLSSSAASGSIAFRIRIVMAEVAVGMKALLLAEGIYAGLVEEADRVGLDAWEPRLAADLYAKYGACLKGLSRDDRLMAERSRMIYRRLCRVDPARALASGD